MLRFHWFRKFVQVLYSAHTLWRGREFEVDRETFYLKENETRAFAKPCFTSPGMVESAVESLLASKHTLKELTTFFEERNSRSGKEFVPLPVADKSPPILPPIDTEQLSSTGVVEGITGTSSFDLESPRFLSDSAGIFSVPPQLSFDVDDEDLNPFSVLAESQAPELVTLLQEFHQRFVNLNLKWSHTFLEVDAGHALVVKDLQTLHEKSKSLKASLNFLEDGNKKLSASFTTQLQELDAGFHHVSDLCALTSNQLFNTKEEIKSFQESFSASLDDVSLQSQTATAALATLDAKLSTLDRLSKEFDKRFTILFLIIKEFHQAKVSSPTLLDIQQSVAELQEKLASMDQSAWQGIHVTPSPVSVTQTPIPGSADFQDFKHQLKVLQHRIVGGGVKIGTRVFQSFEDVQVWVKLELPIRRYGLFVDAVSILDFFSCLGHIDAENQVSTLHNANKAGFTSIYESLGFWQGGLSSIFASHSTA